MPKVSAGLLLYRKRNNACQVFLVHPGGPLWSGKDGGAWSIPKGLVDPGEEPLSAALREVTEETGCKAFGPFIPLTSVTLKSGKIIRAWAVEGNCDPSTISSNTFSMEWPPRSGRQQEFPEVDRAAWFAIGEAREKINQGQVAFLDEFHDLLSEECGGGESNSP